MSSKERPKTEHSGFSGKFVIRISPKLHESLVKRSTRTGQSLNQICTDFLTNGLDKHSAPHDLSDKIRRVFGDALIGIVLFGSRARGSAMDTSDTDLLLVFSADTEITRALYRKWDGEADPDLSLHCVTFPKRDRTGSLWLEVALDGIVLWERDSAVSEVLRRLKREIAEGNYVREKVHGHGYWRAIA